MRGMRCGRSRIIPAFTFVLRRVWFVASQVSCTCGGSIRWTDLYDVFSDVLLASSGGRTGAEVLLAPLFGGGDDDDFQEVINEAFEVCVRARGVRARAACLLVADS